MIAAIDAFFEKLEGVDFEYVEGEYNTGYVIQDSNKNLCFPK